MMVALDSSSSVSPTNNNSSSPQQQGFGGVGGDGLLAADSLTLNVVGSNNNNNGHYHSSSNSANTTTTTSSSSRGKAPSGKGSSKSKKKTHSKSSKQHSGSSNNNASTSTQNNNGIERRDEELYLENFIKSIEYLPTEMRKDLGTIKELDKKASKNVTLATELADSKSNADRNEAIRKLMDESIDLCHEKVDISQRSLNKIMLHLGDLDKKIEELTQSIQQQKPQTNFKLESLYIPQLSEDNQVHYFTPSDPSLQSSSSKSNKRLVQHSENLKTLKSGSLKSYPEKEMHSHVFNHTPEQEGIVRGNSTTTRSYSSSSSSSTKKAEKEPPSQITVKTSSGSVISVPNDRIGNTDNTLVSISSEQKVKKQKKSSQPKQETAPVNCTPLSINTTSGSTSRKEKLSTSTSSVPKENSIVGSSEISSLKIPKKDLSSSSISSTQAGQPSSTKKSRSIASGSSTIAPPSSNVTNSEQSKTGKKRKPISTASNTGKTKKQKQSATTSVPVGAISNTAEQPINNTDTTLVVFEDLVDPTKYCYCKKTTAEDDSDMVGCDQAGCPNNGWIHKHCLTPGEDPDVPSFICADCIKSKSKKKKRK